MNREISVQRGSSLIVRILGLCVLLTVGISSPSCHKENKSAPTKYDGNALLGIAVKDLSGRTVDLTAYKGKVLMLNFWASWCGPCREEMPAMDMLYRKYHDKGLAVVGVSVDYDITSAAAFANEVKVSYPLFWDGDNGKLAKAIGGVVVLPTTMLYNKDGRLVKTILGPRDIAGFEKEVKDLIITAS